MGKLRALQKKEPHNIYIAITLGQLLQHSHHYEQALESFNLAIDLLEQQQPNTQDLATSLTLTCLKQKGYCLEKQKQQATTQASVS
jgi:predicted Zn-dependent protease